MYVVDIAALIHAFAAPYAIVALVVVVVFVILSLVGAVQYVIAVHAHAALKLLLLVIPLQYAVLPVDPHVEALVELHADLLVILLVNLFVDHLVFLLVKWLAFHLELLVVQLCILIIK